MEEFKNIEIGAYNYQLPDEQIARYPLAQRDASKLLVYEQGCIHQTTFNQLPRLLPANAQLVFNNTQVIRARLLFKKPSGAQIELFCLEPVAPPSYQEAFEQTCGCSWKCLIGNLKKWKEGTLLQTLLFNNRRVTLEAAHTQSLADCHLVTFSWDDPLITFAEILESAGVLPIPPYLNRATEPADLHTYQTVYAQQKGSVAAPTAGLHFTPQTLAEMDAKGIRRDEITLHVGAGTFRPVKSQTIGLHTMHTETFTVTKNTLEHLLNHKNKRIAVGTTSVRALESLYYLGAALAKNPALQMNELCVEQWAPYKGELPPITTNDALNELLQLLTRQKTDQLTASTQIMLVPGYTFRLIDGMLTNFHQPQSTLLLLVSAFVQGDWKKIYDYALAHDFRFLSYGDSSLLL